MSRSIEPEWGICEQCGREGAVYDLMGDVVCARCEVTEDDDEDEGAA